MTTENQSPELEGKSQDDPPMPLTAHLAELRKRLMIIVSVLAVVFFGASWVEINMGQPILSLFRQPLDLRGVPLVFDELTEPFFTYLRVGFYTALFTTFPIILWQLWQFVKPALYIEERKFGLIFVILSYPLFVGGGLFGYFIVIPYGYDFFLGFQNAVTQPSLRMGEYLTLTIRLLFAFGLIFELPVISFFLTRLGVINYRWLSTNRKYSIVIIFIVSAILTPPDVFTQTLMAGPLLILFEISIWVSRFSEPKHLKEAREMET